MRWDCAAKPLILMVEDDAGVRARVRFVLEQAGFQVVEAADVAEAQACLAQQLPALMLLDWMLPGTSGMTFARQIRRHPVFKAMPLMMLTARGGRRRPGAGGLAAERRSRATASIETPPCGGVAPPSV